MTSASAPLAALARPGRWAWRPPGWWRRWGFWLLGAVALVAYLAPGLLAPAAHWPLWDVRVYAWGGQQADKGGGLYSPGSPYSFTYPPFAAWLFADVPIGVLKGVLFAGSVAALAVLTGQALTAAGIRHRLDVVFGVSCLALLSSPVAYTLHLGEVNLILAALVGSDLMRRQDGSRWQGVATGLAAGIKLTPLIFAVYLLVTGRVRGAVTAAGTFLATVAAGYLGFPAQSGIFWLGGVFGDPRRIGNQANPSDQSLAGALARLAGSTEPPRVWWLAAATVTGLAGLAVAVWAHRRGHRLAGVVCCAITGLLISPVSWTHHWVWAVPLVMWLAVAAWRRRSWLTGLGAAAASSVFSGIPLVWAGRPLDAGRLLASDLYVLCGLTVLAGTALALGRERQQGGAGRRRAAHRRGHRFRLLPALPGVRRVLRRGRVVRDPDSGLLGRDPGSHGPRREIRRRLGYLPQNLGYYPGFTVAEFVRTADDPGKAAAVGGPDASSRRWGMAREDMWLLQLGRFGVLAGVVVAAGRDPAITSSPASVWR